MHLRLSLECAVLTIGLPLVLYGTADRIVMLSALWGGALLIFLWLQRQVSWREIWHGVGIMPAYRVHMIWRFIILVAVGIMATLALAPEKFLAFPAERPRIWLMVILLYPFLSVLPQEIIYRSFFFRRYAPLATPAVLTALSAIAFGLSHLMMNNWVAPVLSIFGGLIFADTYARTRSLKYVCIEHAAYGCAIFTIGLGWFFYLGNWR